jgi:hypothetical protein
MKITALEKIVDFTTLITKKLFSRLKSHELSRKDHPNYNASFSSNTLITSARIDDYDANSTTAISSASKFTLSSLPAASHELIKLLT